MCTWTLKTYVYLFFMQCFLLAVSVLGLWYRSPGGRGAEWFLPGRAHVETQVLPTSVCCGRSAARTSGMGPGPCLRGSSGGGASSSALRCHSRTLENEGQSTSRVSGFTNCRKKIPWVAFLHLWRMTVNTYPWGLQCEGDLSWESWGQLWAGHRGRWPGGRELLQPTWVWGLTHSCLHQESLV